MEAIAHIAALNKRFGIEGVAQVVAGKGGLPMVRVNTKAAKGEVYLYGAQVTSWAPAGEPEVLFLSQDSYWEDGRAIRGGIPICLPWFGDKADDSNAPKHGFVRTREWRLDALSADEHGCVTLVCVLENDAGNALWPHEFCAVYRVTIGATLRLELSVINNGTSPMRFEEALHSYLRVGDVRQIRVEGLENTRYLDKTEKYKEKLQGGPIEITEETDRVFLQTRKPVEVVDGSLARRIVTEKKNSGTSVVWNPWKKLAAELPDFGDEEWLEMVCVEGCNVLHSPVVIEPDEEHSLVVTLRVERE